MQCIKWSAACALLAAGVVAAAEPAVPAAASTAPILFGAVSRIEVDAEGRVLSVAATPSLPEAINTALEENLRRTRFSPARKDGRPVAGVTFARQEACAVPDGGRFRLAVRFLGNGPGAPRFDGARVPLSFPASRNGPRPDTEFKIGYRVQADGAIAFESFEQLSGRKGSSRDIESTARKWLEGQRADPEQLDGQPVSTQVNFTLQFKGGGGMTFTGPNAREQAQRHVEASVKADRERRIAESGACTAAWAARDAEGPSQHVAVNSPFHVLETVQ